MSTPEILSILSKTKTELNFSETSGHWQTGRLPDNSFYLNYFCCENCGNETHETYLNLSELRDNLKYHTETNWIKL